MGFSYVTSVSNYASGAGTTLDTVGSLNVLAGDVLVGSCTWSGGDTVATLAETGAGNALTMFARIISTDTYLRMGYKIGADENNTTWRMTTADSRTYRYFCIMQFRPDAGETVTLDAGPSAGTGSGTAPQSGNVDTSGIDEIIVGTSSSFDFATVTSELIADGAATGAVDVGSGGDILLGIWYKIFTEDPGDAIHAQATLGSSQRWCCDICAIKSVEAAVTLEQEGFRARNDDGNEVAATWLADQDTNFTRAKNTNTRLRMLLNATGDPPANAYRIEVRKQGVGDYKKIN